MVGLSTTRERSTLDPTSPTLLIAEPVYDDPVRGVTMPVPEPAPSASAPNPAAPFEALSPADAARDAAPLTAVPVAWSDEVRPSPARSTAPERTRLDEPHRLPKVFDRQAVPPSPDQSTLLPGLGTWLHQARRMLLASGISAVVHTVGLLILGGLFLQAESATSPPEPIIVVVEPPQLADHLQEPVVVALEAEKLETKSDAHAVGSGRGSAGAGGGKGGGSFGGLQIALAVGNVEKTGTGGTGFGVDRAYGEHMLGEVGEVKNGATFFGIKSEGRKFAYVVDTSGSMFQNGRYIRCREELIRSLLGLGYGQKYFIVFFNSNTFPMPERKLVEVRAPQVQKTINWINQALPMGFTEPLDGLLMALRHKPDAIFLLTDGEFNPEVVKKIIAAQPGSKKIPIHTIAFESQAGEETLITISRTTGGLYQYVP